MNENLNLIEILKDCPKGTKLYSTMYGDVKFESINEKKSHPIIVRIGEDHTECFSIDGKIYSFYDGECTLFPSRDERDWSKFKPKCRKADDARLYLANLWRGASEEPKGDNWKILCVDVYDKCWVDNRVNAFLLHNKWDEYAAIELVKMWAYIDDLLPKQFGNSEQLKGGEK